jgi:hypothetical protein
MRYFETLHLPMDWQVERWNLGFPDTAVPVEIFRRLEEPGLAKRYDSLSTQDASDDCVRLAVPSCEG